MFEESSDVFLRALGEWGCGGGRLPSGRGWWPSEQDSGCEGREQTRSRARWRSRKQEVAGDGLREVMECIWCLGGEWSRAAGSEVRWTLFQILSLSLSTK